MLIGSLITGEEIHRYQKSIVVKFTGRRKTLSTAPVNGGLREDLTAVFNNDGTIGAGMAAKLKAPTYEEHNGVLSRELGLDPDYTAGIGTAAQMENVSIKSESYKDITVTAVVTGGVEVNGGRVGDPASWDELAETSLGVESAATGGTHRLGTINIMLFVNVNLTDGALTRALVTCTEAKTAALQELAAPSQYSRGLATGSGTDSTIIVCNSESSITLTNAGKHVKLGELIGTTVKAAVKEALSLQSNLNPKRQHNVLRLVSRFGITAETLWEKSGFKVDKGRYWVILENMSSDSALVTTAALYAHLIDRLDWGLSSFEETKIFAKRLLEPFGGGELPENVSADYVEILVSALEDTLARQVSAAHMPETENCEVGT